MNTTVAKIKELRLKIYEPRYRDHRLIEDALRDIQAQAIALEVFASALEKENHRLTFEVNKGKEDVEVAF